MIFSSLTLVICSLILFVFDRRNRYSLFFAAIAIGCALSFFALLLHISSFNNYYISSSTNPFYALDNIVYVALMHKVHLPFTVILRIMNLGLVIFFTSHILLYMEIRACMVKKGRPSLWRKCLRMCAFLVPLAMVIILDPDTSTRLYILLKIHPDYLSAAKALSILFKIVETIVVIMPLIALVVYAARIGVQWFKKRILFLTFTMGLVDIGFCLCFLYGEFGASLDKVCKFGFWHFETSQPKLVIMSLIPIATMLMMGLCLIVLLTFKMDGSAVFGMRKKVLQNINSLNGTLGDVLHSYKNTLFAIQLQMRKLQNHSGETCPEELLKAAELVNNSLDDTTRMLNYLSTQRYKFCKNSISDIVLSALNDLHVPENIHLEVDPSVMNEELTGYYDRYHIRMALVNVLSNAMEAIARSGRKNGKIKVSLIHFFRWITIVVEDNGEGISREKRRKIFIPHYSTKNGKLNYGLGMTQVYRAVSAHFGQIKVSSREGSYTAVMIMLPINSGER